MLNGIDRQRKMIILLYCVHVHAGVYACLFFILKSDIINAYLVCVILGVCSPVYMLLPPPDVV